MKFNLILSAASMCMLLLFTGCTSFKNKSPLNESIDQLLDNRWALEGKLAVRTPNDNVTAFIRWQQIDESFRIYLSGPLGQGNAEIISTPNQGARFIRGKENINAPSADELFQQQMGWFFPVSYVKYWVSGRPYPNAEPIFFAQPKFPNQTQEEEKQYSEFQQANWQIRVSEYTSNGNFHTPKKLTLEYPSGAEKPDIKLKFVIKKWDISFPEME